MHWAADVVFGIIMRACYLYVMDKPGQVSILGCLGGGGGGGGVAFVLVPILYSTPMGRNGGMAPTSLFLCLREVHYN